jgi:hypothetical protein
LIAVGYNSYLTSTRHSSTERWGLCLSHLADQNTLPIVE